MKNKQIIDAWNSVEIDGNADTKMLHAILVRKCVLDKRQERYENILLCFVQIIMFAAALSIVSILLIVSPKTAVFLLLGHIALGGFMSVIIILLHSKKYQERSRRV